MPTLSQLSTLTNYTDSVLFPVIDTSVTPRTTKNATFGNIRKYLADTVSVSSVQGRHGDVVITVRDLAGLSTVSTSGRYVDLIGLPATFPVATATRTTLGGVKIDGTTIGINSLTGVISVIGGGGGNFDPRNTLNLSSSTYISFNDPTTSTVNQLIVGEYIDGGLQLSLNDPASLIRLTDGSIANITVWGTTGYSLGKENNSVEITSDHTGDVDAYYATLLVGQPHLDQLNTGFGTYTTVAYTYNQGGISIDLGDITLSNGGVGQGGNLVLRTIGSKIIFPDGTYFNTANVNVVNTSSQLSGPYLTLNATSTSTNINNSGGVVIRRSQDPLSAAGMIYNDTYGWYENFFDPHTRGAFGFYVGTDLSAIIVNAIRTNTTATQLSLLGGNSPNAVLTVKGTNNYAGNVVDPDHIPNKQYTDNQALISKTYDTTSSFIMEWNVWSNTTATTMGYTGTYGGGLFIGDIGGVKDTNILIGSQAGQSITVDAQPNGIGGWDRFGSYNLVIGQNAGMAIDVGNNNVYLGSGAGGWQSSGNDNVAIGNGAGANSAFYDSGSRIDRSIAIGSGALSNVYGTDNLGIGYFAGNSLASGNYNVVIGADSAGDLANTNYNVVISDMGQNRKTKWDANGTQTHPGRLIITSSTQSVSSLTGALSVVGGVGIGGRLNVSNTVTIYSTVASVSTLTGALVVNGGVGVRGDIYARNVYANGVLLGSGGGGSSTLGGLTDVALSLPVTDGQVLKYSASAGKWSNGTDNTGGGSNGLTGRSYFSTTATSLAPGASANNIISGFKGYALLSVQTSAAAWVTVYSSTSARTADASRTITTDPTPGSGVIAEVITVNSSTQYFTPALIGFSSEIVPSINVPIKIYNNGASTATITVTVTMIQLEA